MDMKQSLCRKCQRRLFAMSFAQLTLTTARSKLEVRSRQVSQANGRMPSLIT